MRTGCFCRQAVLRKQSAGSIGRAPAREREARVVDAVHRHLEVHSTAPTSILLRAMDARLPAARIVRRGRTPGARDRRAGARWRPAEGANPHTNGGLLKRELHLRDFAAYAVKVESPVPSKAEATRVMGSSAAPSVTGDKRWLRRSRGLLRDAACSRLCCSEANQSRASFWDARRAVFVARSFADF